MAKEEELLSLAGIARAQGVTRQTVQARAKTLPTADFWIGAGRRRTQLWRRSTLERAEIRLEPKPAKMGSD